MASTGSTLFRLTWKERATPSGRRICALRASAHRTSGSDCTSWPSPKAKDGREYSAGANPKSASGHGLGAIAAKTGSWATPQANQANGTPERFLARKVESMARGSQSMGVSLSDLQMQAIAFCSWATPTTRDHKDGASDGTAPINILLGRQTWLTAETGSKGQLNPAHSRWLMGYPAVWDFCGAMAMQSCRKSPRRSSKHT